MGVAPEVVRPRPEQGRAKQQDRRQVGEHAGGDGAGPEGLLEIVGLPGSRRRWLVPPGLFEGAPRSPDDRLRILGPLDPLLWDRWLVERLWGFRYVWEVYKPAAQRRWGWYVCPLLHRGQLVGRLEGRLREHRLDIDRIWAEPGRSLDRAALDSCLRRHALACGAEELRYPEGPALAGV